MLEKLPDVIGHALFDQRAGLDKLAFNKVGLRSGMAAITVSSLAFQDHAPLPALYTADGAGTSPSLQWTGLPPGDGALREGALDEEEGHAPEWACGLNSFLQAHWLPPDPPPGHGVHRYAFQLFALATMPAWSAKPGREEVLEILQAHAVASGCLIGTYERPDGSQKIEQAEPVAVPLGRLAV